MYVQTTFKCDMVTDLRRRRGGGLSEYCKVFYKNCSFLLPQNRKKMGFLCGGGGKEGRKEVLEIPAH